jgi:hypothetical protein
MSVRTGRASWVAAVTRVPLSVSARLVAAGYVVEGAEGITLTLPGGAT